MILHLEDAEQEPGLGVLKPALEDLQRRCAELEKALETALRAAFRDALNRVRALLLAGAGGSGESGASRASGASVVPDPTAPMAESASLQTAMGSYKLAIAHATRALASLGLERECEREFSAVFMSDLVREAGAKVEGGLSIKPFFAVLQGTFHFCEGFQIMSCLAVGKLLRGLFRDVLFRDARRLSLYLRTPQKSCSTSPLTTVVCFSTWPGQ